MESVIYIDVVFFCTFAMHFLILTASKYILGSPVKKKRIAAGAFLSSGMGCFFLTAGWNGWTAAAVMQITAVMVTFFPKTVRRFFPCLAAVLFSTFLFGGGMAAAMTIGQTSRFWGESGMWNKGRLSWQFFLWAWLVFYILLRLLRRWLLRYTAKRNLYCQAKIMRLGKCIEIKGFFDTGNGLRYGGKAVPILELSSCLPLFARETGIRLIKREPFSKEAQERERLTETGYSALGLEEGTLMLFSADCLSFWWDGKEKRIQDLWIGISTHPFSGGYQMLIPTDLLEEERK